LRMSARTNFESSLFHKTTIDTKQVLFCLEEY